MINNLPSDIQSYFAEIAERLWTGHASVMIGAGFSKNAINTIHPTKQPPNWWELGDTFYEKLHGKKPTDDIKYASLLKLAEEYEAAFGRSALEHFIAKNIADNEYEPSDLHKRLMELPWTDVLTTNYDTLLERSCKDVISRRYDVVVNKNDLVYSNKPRIIKLHGSLPSERPFIITEEDYRNYPKKYAPFVNTVQQSLLENTLCLLGFSGDDPNFLQWIGWINDNIGKNNASKIYLVGVLRLSESQKKLLNNKNIIPVDLSGYSSINGDHRKGLETFIEYLTCQKLKRDNLNWPSLQDLKTPEKSKEKVGFEALIQGWRNCRKKYPNWLILPQEQRERLLMYTEMHIGDISVFDNLNEFEELDYIYELNWRLEKCLFPIWNDTAFCFQNILNKYNFFPDDILESRDINIQNRNITRSEKEKYKNFWIQLSLSLLRFYREEDFNEEWNQTYNILSSIKQHLSSDQLSLFYYEQILGAVFKLKFNEAKKILDEWPQNDISVLWNAKRAMLLSEFGQSKEAAKLLESNLLEIRKKLNLSPIEDDYTWVSLESYVMLQLKMVHVNIRFLNNEDYNERWNDLLQYNCDPWGEKKYFDLMLQQPYFPLENVSINKNFEIGKSTRTYTSGRTSEDFILAYTFLRYIEELAIPLSSPTASFSDKTINGVLKRIRLVSPTWGIAILNRSTDEKAVDTIFNREQMLKLSKSTIDAYSEEYIKKFYEFLPEKNSNPIAKAFIHKIPYILSRLCTKCSDSLKFDMYKLCCELYVQELELPNSNKFLINLINSSSSELLREAIDILLNFPILNPDWAISYTLVEPFNYIQQQHKTHGKRVIRKEIFDNLIEKAKEDNNIRQNAIKRLMFLYNSNQLNKTQSKILFDTIWRFRDEKYGFPKNTFFYHFAFIKWPQPKGINVEEMYRNYIDENNFNVQRLIKKKEIGMSKGNDRYFDELLYGSERNNKADGVIWSIEELEKILIKCKTWWRLDKKYIIEDKYKDEGFGGSIYQEFMARFTNLTNIISRVLGYRKNDLNKNIISQIKTLSTEMESSNMPVLKVKVVFGFYNHYEDYLLELRNGLLSKNRQVLLDALDSVILAVHSSPYQNDVIFINRLLDILLTPLQWKIIDLFVDIFDVFRDFIENSNIDLASIKKELYNSLKYVLKLSDEDKINFDDYLLLKQKSISLAATVYKDCIEKNISVPQVILDWKAVSEDEEEFGDLRNKWII